MLPWVVINPSGVANFFNVGSLIIIASFAILYGPEEFFKRRLLKGPKKGYIIGYLVSLVICLYASIIRGSFILTFLALMAEFGFMLYFIASYFPGGRDGMTKLLKAAGSLLVSCCKKQVASLNH